MEKGSILKLKIDKQLFIYAILAMVWAIPSLAFAAEKPSESTEAPYDPKIAIFEHIGDSHSWPIVGKHSLPLLIILYTANGIESFSSARLDEGQVYHGTHNNYVLEENKVKIVDANGKVDEAANKKLLDFSITRNVASMWLGMAVLLIIFLGIAGRYGKNAGKAPKGMQSLMEPLILFVRDDVAIPNIGTKHIKFMPLLLTIFFFILVNNLFGLIPFFPGGYNLTGNIAVTITLSFIVFVVINFSGNKYYWKHIFLPDIPFWLYPIMVPVEIIGIFSKPIALLIRLFANITAGHIVVLSLVSLIFIFRSLWMSAVSVPFVVFMDVIEVLVAFLQAYIFTMLSALFIGLAVEEHHH